MLSYLCNKNTKTACPPSVKVVKVKVKVKVVKVKVKVKVGKVKVSFLKYTARSFSTLRDQAEGPLR